MEGFKEIRIKAAGDDVAGFHDACMKAGVSGPNLLRVMIYCIADGGLVSGSRSIGRAVRRVAALEDEFEKNVDRWAAEIVQKARSGSHTGVRSELRTGAQ